MKRKYLLLGLVIFTGVALSNSVQAVCPICAVAVGAGLGLSRWLGIDDLVSSVWIGALLASLSIWTIIWLSKKGWNFKYSKVVIPLSYYLVTIAPFYYYSVIGHSLNKIFGIDKIIFGIILGTIIFLFGVWFNDFLKTKNQGKQFFAYQKVVLPVLILIIISLILWLII